MDSTNYELCSTIVCIYWKNLYVSEHMQFKHVLLKGQLYYEQLYTSKMDNPEEMDKFLETYTLPRLNWEERNSKYEQTITSKEIESVI